MEVPQARGQIGAVAASLRHSHSNTGSKPRLRPTPQLTWMLNPLSKARDQTRNLMVTSQIHFCFTTMGTPENPVAFFLVSSVVGLGGTGALKLLHQPGNSINEVLIAKFLIFKPEGLYHGTIFFFDFVSNVDLVFMPRLAL